MPFLSSWGPGLSLVLSIAAVGGMFVGYGRWLEKLNGVGKRAASLEEESTKARTERENLTRQLSRVLDHQEQMLEKLGESRRGTEACREDTENLGIKIGTEIHGLTHTVHEMDKSLSVRLGNVETILKERKIST